MTDQPNDPAVPLDADEARRLLEAHGLGDMTALLGVQRPPQPDPFSDWCDTCEVWHQRRDRPIRCLRAHCVTLTDSYHGTCPKHTR